MVEVDPTPVPTPFGTLPLPTDAGLPWWAYVLLYLGGFAIVGFLVWFQNTRTIPKLVESNTSNMKALVEANSSAMTDLLAAHRIEMKELRFEAAESAKAEAERCERRHTELVRTQDLIREKLHALSGAVQGRNFADAANERVSNPGRQKPDAGGSD